MTLRSYGEASHGTEPLTPLTTVANAQVMKTSVPIIPCENQQEDYTPINKYIVHIPVLDDPIESTEVKLCIRKLKVDKAPGTDGIAPGILKILDDEWILLLTFAFNAVFEGSYPECWNKARVMNIYKKGNRLSPGNYRGISIMNAMVKLYDMVLAERFSLWYKPHEEQAGAQKGRGCSEQILAVRLLIDVARKSKKTLFLCFIDFEKAYDRLDRYQLMKRLDSRGCGSRFLNALQQSYARTEGLIGDYCFE